MTRITSILILVFLGVSISCNQKKLLKTEHVNSNSIVVNILPGNKLEINGQEESQESLGKIVEKFIKENIKNNQVFVKINNGADYHFYLNTSNLIREIFYKERNKESIKRYGKSFDKLRKSKQEKLKIDIPLNLIIEYE